MSGKTVASTVEAISKSVPVFYALTALVVVSVFGQTAVPALPFVTGLALAIGLVMGRCFRERSLVPWLVLLYVAPGLFYTVFRTPYFPFLPWLAGNLGLLVGSVGIGRWYLPAAWKVPIALWALMLALSAPVVALRELDFAPDLTLALRLASNGVRTPHTVTVALALFFPMLSIVGFLWLDGLFYHFRHRAASEFRRWVLVPLGTSFLLTALAAAVQTWLDVRFMNRPRWIGLQAVPGGLLDPNPLGLLSALAGPALLAAVGPLRSYPGRLSVLAGIGTAAFGVLASGSRTALLLGSAGLAGSVWVTLGTLRRRWTRWVLAALVAVSLLAGAYLFSGTYLGRGIARLPLSQAFPDPVRFLREQVADRLPFYRAAGAMLREVPLTGVGSGTYYVLVSDYGLRYLGDPLHFDNAQNWYLHQLAELGVLGSLGWILWGAAFVRTVLTRPAQPDARVSAGILKMLLVLFGGASLVGAHAQDGAVLITFWTLVFWAAQALGPTELLPSVGSWKAWVAVGGLALLYGGAQVYVGVHRLRPPLRAAAVGWGYTYGFYPLERDPVLGPFRWTRAKAVTVLPVQGPRLRLRMFVHHPDVARRPVRVTVWLDDRRVLQMWLRDTRVHTWEVSLPTDRPRVVLTVHVSRTWRPVDYGRSDPRELGVGVGL